MCDRRTAAGVKGKVHKTVVRAAVMSSLETAALSRRLEAELEVAQLSLLRS